MSSKCNPITFLVVFGAQRLTGPGTVIEPTTGYASQSSQPSLQSELNIGTAELNSRLAGAARYGSAQLASTGNTLGASSTDSELRPKATVMVVKPILNVDRYLQQHARNAALSGKGGTSFAKTAAFKIEQ